MSVRSVTSLCLHLGLIFAVACGNGNGNATGGDSVGTDTASVKDTGGGGMTVTSPAFTAGAAISAAFSCEGANDFPGLNWSGAPAGTQSFVLTVTDTDVPDEFPPTPQSGRIEWSHWIVYDIKAGTDSLAQGPGNAILPADAQQVSEWFGPCPPDGDIVHNYHFRVYALDKTLGTDPSGFQKPQGEDPLTDFLSAINGFILGQAEIVGTYEIK